MKDFKGRREIKIMKDVLKSETWKMHMSDKCAFMVKNPEDIRYSSYIKF